MPQFPTFGAEVPVCPLCDGPCKHEFERSEWVFPDRLPRSPEAVEEPPKAKPPNLRARRLAEDRMHRPQEDREPGGEE